MTITLREFIGREITYCVSSLVSDLSTLLQNADSETLAQIGYSWEEDILPLLEYTDYEEAGRQHIAGLGREDLIELLEDAGVEDERSEEMQIAAENAVCAAYASEHGEMIDEDDLLLRWPGVSDEQLREKLCADIDSLVCGWEEFCREHDVDTDDYRSEVYEHWIVTGWLAERLSAHGHVTGEIMGLTIWGRPTTGQSISMDSVIQEIYKELTGRDVTSAGY